MSVVSLGSGAYVVWLGHPDDTDLEASGSTWAQFAEANPEIATVVSREYRLQGLLLIAFALLSIAFIWNAFRVGMRWARFTSWIFPILYVVVAVAVPRPDVRYYYAALAVVAVVAIAGAHRSERLDRLAASSST